MRSSVRAWCSATPREMTDFWLIRHGSTDTLQRELAGRASAVALNSAGRTEVEALARRIARCGAQHVYSSPLERALQTARPLAARLGCEVSPLPGIIELEFGTWTGRRFPELDADPRWRDFNAFRSGTSVPGGEHMLDVQARAVHSLLTLRERHSQERVLIVTHADVIRAVLLHFLGMPQDLFWRLEIAPASITQLELTSSAARLLRANDRGHLEDTG